jgi:AcrR family transcriptional regulator
LERQLQFLRYPGAVAVDPAVNPNRRGMRSRELVLDAAEHVMAEDGFEAATLARVVAESGIPMSSVYHYYGSKDGILLAVMERGAERFFADLPDWDRRIGRPGQHLALISSTAVEKLERHPNFLRLLIVFAAQPPTGGDGESGRSPGASARSPCNGCAGRLRSPSTTTSAARPPTNSHASRSPPSTEPS